MKKYRQLVESLPRREVVFTFEDFSPPTAGHSALVRVVQGLALKEHADHIIFAQRTESASNPIPDNRKIHYLNLMLPTSNFELADSVSECVDMLKHRYKSITFVTTNNLSEGSCRNIRLDNFQKLKTEQIKLQKLARKGLFEDFKCGLPLSVREIDARRLMNDIRESSGLEIIKDNVITSVDDLREQYFKGQIYNVGDIVESADERYEIIKRGTNHLLLKSSDGSTKSKWIHEVTQGQ